MKALAIDGLTTDEDLHWLAARAVGHQVIVEIGAYQGRSTRALADANEFGIVYAIDNWDSTISAGRSDEFTRAAFHRNCSDLSDRVIPIEWDSRCGVPPALRDLSVDMLWIDGDHSYDAVASDIRNFAPLVRAGGLICGHDYCVWHPEVMRAVDEAYGPRVQLIDIHRSIWWVNA
jgi:predicted O-methyltransferase YrrM